MLLEEPKESYGDGWVKLHRSVMNKAWYKKPEYCHLWNHLILKATHKPFETWFEGKPIKLNPGQFITGRKKLAEETGIHESSIERILTYFEKIEQQIEQRKTSTSRCISIVNYSTYQHSEQQFEQPLNNGRTTAEQPLNTIQEHNNTITEEKRESTSPASQATPAKVKIGLEELKQKLEARKQEFKKTLVPFKEKYGVNMLKAFYEYWTEPNKSFTKMRFELNKTWSVSLRLATWASKDKDFVKKEAGGEMQKLNYDN